MHINFSRFNHELLLRPELFLIVLIIDAQINIKWKILRKMTSYLYILEFVFVELVFSKAFITAFRALNTEVMLPPGRIACFLLKLLKKWKLCFLWRSRLLKKLNEENDDYANLKKTIAKI